MTEIQDFVWCGNVAETSLKEQFLNQGNQASKCVRNGCDGGLFAGLARSMVIVKGLVRPK